MKTHPYQEIADKVNKERKINTITAEQVKEVANGEDKTESHPVISIIIAELRKQKFL